MMEGSNLVLNEGLEMITSRHIRPDRLMGTIKESSQTNSLLWRDIVLPKNIVAKIHECNKSSSVLHQAFHETTAVLRQCKVRHSPRCL